MITVLRTNSSNGDFVRLVRLLDADLAIRDGDEHSFYSQFNKIDNIGQVVVAYQDGIAVGCGAMKAFSSGIAEVKRMWVSPSSRNSGIATTILAELERWAKELSYTKCILETGKRQPEAIALYEKNGYRRTANYGQYTGVENSICFEKLLR